MSPTTTTTGEVRRQHTQWANAHARLMNAPPRPPKATSRRPASPFSAETKRTRDIAEQTRMHRLFPKVIVEVDDDGNEVLPAVTSPRWRIILDSVLASHGVTFSEVMSIRRDKVVAAARFEAMWRLTKETTMSLPAIGRKFGRDHTSVLYAVRKHDKLVRARQVNEPLKARADTGVSINGGING